MQSMVTIRPHQAQARVMVLPTEESPKPSDTRTNWFKTTSCRNQNGLISIIRSKLSNSSQNQNTAADNLLCTLPRTTLQRRPANSALTTTPALARSQAGHQSGLQLHPEQPSTVTVSPYDTALACPGPDRLIINGCDTDDSSDSQYASVANLPSPISKRRHQQQQQQHQPPNYYTTNRLQPSRQSQPQRNPYISPQLSRLTSTLRSYGYNPMETCSNSSACSSPQRTVMTNLSSSSTTVSSAQLGSPHIFFNGRYMQDNNSVCGPMTDSSNLGHVYCEIPASMATSSRANQTSSTTGNYDNVRWQNMTQGRYRQPHRPIPPPKYSRELDVDDTTTYAADDTTCDIQNVSDLSEDEYQQRDFRLNVDSHFPFPVSESLVRELKSPKKKRRPARAVEAKSAKRNGPGVDRSKAKFTTSREEMWDNEWMQVSEWVKGRKMENRHLHGYTIVWTDRHCSRLK